jgi:hypothetical protein
LNGIYPNWATNVQAIAQPQDARKRHFATIQEAVRENVEYCFGVLQAHFAIIRGPARGWKKKDLHAIMTTYIILHNMIVENERNLNDVLTDSISSSQGAAEDGDIHNNALNEFIQ